MLPYMAKLLFLPFSYIHCQIVNGAKTFDIFVGDLDPIVILDS